MILLLIYGPYFKNLSQWKTDVSFYDFKYGSVVKVHDTDLRILDVGDIILIQFRKWVRVIVSQII